MKVIAVITVKAVNSGTCWYSLHIFLYFKITWHLKRKEYLRDMERKETTKNI